MRAHSDACSIKVGGIGVSRRRLVALGCLAALGLAACGPPPASPTAAPAPTKPSSAPPAGTPAPTAPPTESVTRTAPAAKPTVAFNPTLRMQLSPNLVNATLLTAVQKKYLEDEGLKPEVEITTSAPAISLQLLAGAKIDVSSTNPSSGLNNALLKGSAIMALASGSKIPKDHPASGLMISEKLQNEGVRSIKDLKGRTINIFPGFDSTSGRVMALLLAREGLDYRKDITVQDWTDNAQLQQAFIGGAVDNFYALEPAATIVRLQTKARFLASSTDVIPGSTALLILGNSDFVKANPETTVRLLKAYLRGNRYFNDALQSNWTKNPDVLTIMEQATKAKVDLLRQVGWNDFADDGAIDLGDLRATMQFFKDLGTTPDIFPFEKWVDQTYVQEAYRRLKQEGKL